MEQAFKDLLMKRAKEQGDVDPKKLKAKADMMKELSGLIEGGMKGNLDGLRKVTVASDSPEGIEKGLDLAKKKIADMSSKDEDPSDMEDMADDEMPEDESEDMPEDASEKSPEDADAEIAELEKKIAELKTNKLK